MTAPLPATAKPVLWKLARISYDSVRQRRVLLYPEGAMFLNDSGAAILALCDGTRTLAQVAAELSARYNGADVSADVTEYLTQLAARELIHDAA